MKKVEFSKKILLLLTFFCAAGIIMSYILAWFEKPLNDGVTMALITGVIAPYAGYLIYQAKLKMSRDKYRVDENGVPFGNDSEIEEE